MGNFLQGRFIRIPLLSTLLVIHSASAADAATLAPQLDALVSTIVHRPYGSALPADPSEEPTPLPRNALPVSLEPHDTPAAALLLHWSGQALDNDAYTLAARKLARGIVAAQDPTGRVPSRAVFGTTVSHRDRATLLPDRAPTVAALVALATIARPDHRDDEALRRAAARCANWLLKQQAARGGWPILHESDSPNPQRTRVIRLDTPDYRNTTLALLYAADALDDKRLRRSADQALDFLLTLRPEKSRTAAGLWRKAYDFNAAPFASFGHASAIDTLATRYALETLFAAGLLLDRPDLLSAAQLTHGNLRALRYENGLWDRYYPLSGGNDVRRPAPLPIEPELTPLDRRDPQTIPRTFALDGIMAELDQYLLEGPESFRQRVLARNALQQRIAWSICTGAPLWKSAVPPQNAERLFRDPDAQEVPASQLESLHELLSQLKAPPASDR